MAKTAFFIKLRLTACLLAVTVISTMFLGGCGGSNQATAPPASASVAATSGLLKLGTAGSASGLIGAMDMLVNLPSGVTVDADSSSGEPAAGVVTLSGAAAGSNSLVAVRYASAASGSPATLHIALINASGLHSGEFVTIRFNMSVGASLPALNAFTVTNFSAKGPDSSNLGGITAAPMSVAAANAASKEARLVVTGDVNFLNISVDTPTRNSSQTITGTLFPGDDLTISANHVETKVSAPVITGGTWSAQVNGLVDGANIISVTETNLGAYVASVSATIILDNKSPDLNVDNAILFTKNSRIAIGGTVDDPIYHFIAEFKVDCPTATVDMATAAVPVWSAIINNLTYGDNVCHVTATDVAGNHASKDVHIYYDNLVPDLDIYYNALVKYGIDQYISGIVESGITPVMKVNGYAYAGTMTVNGSNWNCKVGGLVKGANTITVTATDAAGNVATKTVTVTAISATGSFSGLSQPSAADALKALRISIGFDNPTAAELLYGDLYDDGNIDLADAILILRKVVGLPEIALPYSTVQLP